jgi:hypothetical protein
MPEAPTSPEFRIGEGGLLHRVERVAHLTSLRRQIITVVAATWLPLLVVGAVTELVTDREAPLLRDLAVHVRFLVATPVFLILDHVFPRSCRNALNELVASSFVAPEAEPRFEQLIRRASRVADSSAELLLAALAMALGLLGAAGLVPLGGLGRGTPLTAVQLWYALIGWPMFQFLLWRSLWRWAIWAAILYGLSRLRLRLVPTHPDRHGGLGFLTLPSNRYCALLLFALSSVLCAEWGTKLAFSSAVASSRSSSRSSPPARSSRSDRCSCSCRSSTERGSRASRNVASRRASMGGGSSGTGCREARSRCWANVDRMRPVLVDTRGLVVLLVATLLPVVPLMLAHVPREDWSILLKMLTGGRLP